MNRITRGFIPRRRWRRILAAAALVAGVGFAAVPAQAAAAASSICPDANVAAFGPNVDLPSSPPAYAPPIVDPFGTGCTNSAEMWSASQAAPIRRAIINGSVVFQDYCANNNFASGGFIADSKVSGSLNFFGNQQYLVRNSAIGGAAGCPQGLWHMVYSGVQGAPAPVFTGQCQQNTVLSASPVTEEEPFLYTDSGGGFHVFVPAVRRDASGPSWAGGSQAGAS